MLLSLKKLPSSIILSVIAGDPDSPKYPTLG